MSPIDEVKFPKNTNDVKALMEKTYKEAERQIIEILPEGPAKESAKSHLYDSLFAAAEALSDHAVELDFPPPLEPEVSFGETEEESNFLGMKKKKKKA